MEFKLFKRNGINVCYSPVTMDFYLLDTKTLLVMKKIQRREKLSKEEKIKEKEIENTLIAPVRGSISSFDIEARTANYLQVLSRLTLIVTNDCNMRCKYCYESMNDVKYKFNFSSTMGMSLDTAKKALDDYFRVYKRIQTIMFFGGEPTLKANLIKDICAYINDKYTSGTIEQMPSFGIITNGTILNNHIIDIFLKYEFQVTVSLDGGKDDHDRYRILRNGMGSYTKVAENIKKLKERNIPVMIQSTITPESVKVDRDVYELSKQYLNKFGISNPHIVPAQFSDDVWSREVSELLQNEFTEGIQKNLDAIEAGNLDTVYPFSYMISILGALVSKDYKGIRCPAGFEAAISPEGKYYPCFMLVDETYDFSFGSVSTGIDSNHLKKMDSFIMRNFKSLNTECSTCWARGFCTGCLGASYKTGNSLDFNYQITCNLTKQMGEEIILYLSELSSVPERWNCFVENFKRLNATVPGKNETC